MNEEIPSGSNVTFDAIPENTEGSTALATVEPMEKNGDVLMDVSLNEEEQKSFETHQMDLDAEIEKGRLRNTETAENKEAVVNTEEVLKKELTKEEQINIIRSEINDVNSKISELESKTNETINSVNNIRGVLGATNQLTTVESTLPNTEKMLDLSKNLEALIEKQNSLLAEAAKVPGMAEVVETFNPEEHKN